MTIREEWREAWRTFRRLAAVSDRCDEPRDPMGRAAWRCAWKPWDEDELEYMRDTRRANFFVGWTTEDHRTFCRDVLRG